MISRTTLSLCILGSLLPHDDWSEFMKLARDRDPDVRCQAIEKIKRHKDLRMVQALQPLLADAHPRVRSRAVAAMRGADAAEVLEFLAEKSLKSADKHVRQLTIDVLGSYRDTSTIPFVRARLADSEPEVRGQACDALAKLGATDAVGAIVDLFARERDALVRAAALEAVVRIDPASAVEIAEKSIDDRAYQVRMTATETTPRISADLALKAFLAAIKDADWRVRVSAITASMVIRRRECIGALTGQLAKEKGRLRWEIVAALQDLSGKDMGLEAKLWIAWWDVVGDTFEPVARGSAAKQAVDAGGTKAEFFNIPIFSTRILFILDLSGSMRDPAPGKANRTKLDAAREGMCATIRSLDDQVCFSMLGCGSDDDGNYLTKEQKTWRRQLQLWPAHAVNKGDADKWIRSVEAKGWTNLWDAIEYGFSDEHVDTIFLYTDGGVSRGVWVAAGELLHNLKKLNRFRRIVINTVEVPGTAPNPPDNIKLLKDIASETGGVYRLAEGKK